MELIRGIHNLRPRHRGCAVTIGNFDGVHRGHQVLLERNRAWAAHFGVPATVVTFEPHPRELFQPDAAPPRLTDLRGKLRVLRELDLADRVVVLPFNRQLAAMEPETFVERLLVAGLKARQVVVGHDFSFGRARRGTLSDLERLGEARGFGVEVVAEQRVDAAKVGSTAIREALAAGDLGRAESLLGRPYRLCGRVVAGDQVGHTLGFPTANLHTHHRRLPVAGVFTGRVDGAGLQGAPAVVNVGRRPTLHGADARVEIHLLDHDGDLYQRRLDLTFEGRLRDEQAFPDLDALKAQIGRDVAEARRHFGLSGSG
jgi:riboflavin kinase/FMN adenylyltransferase